MLAMKPPTIEPEPVRNEINGDLESFDTTLEPEFAQAILEKHYGIVASGLKKLGSERDQLFLAITDDGEKYTIKFSHPSMDRQAVNFQTKMLLHMNERAPHIPVQRVVPSRSGEIELFLDCNGSMRSARVVSYLDGALLSQSPSSLQQRFNLGQAAGEVTKALATFDHPGKHHVLLWDLQHAELLKKNLSGIEDPDKQARLTSIIETFEKVIKPQLPSLRTQVVHNDYNVENVLVDPDHPDKISGILDFDDAVYTALVNDVAVGATYQIGVVDGPVLDPALAFIKGYDSIIPLTDQEIGLIFDLIFTRFYVRILQYRARAAQSPENKEHLMKKEPEAWHYLELLKGLSASEGRDRILNFREFEW